MQKATMKSQYGTLVVAPRPERTPYAHLEYPELWDSAANGKKSSIFAQLAQLLLLIRGPDAEETVRPGVARSLGTPGGHALYREATMKTAIACGVPLAALNQRSVAVEFVVGARKSTVVGKGVYERDAELGDVLRIEFPSSADGELIFTENTWDGEIVSGEPLGCDFLVRLN
jgi:hypothetical protein